MKSGIYKIFNRVSEKFYIGSAVSFKARWTSHKTALNRQDHKNSALQASWNLHGEAAFEFIILEHCERDRLFEREQFWIDWTRCCDRTIGYNLFPTAGSALGTKWTEQRKARARARMAGFKHSPESIQKMKRVHGNRSQEACAKISAGKMGHTVSEETKAKIGARNRGRKQTDEHRLKISLSNKGRVLSLETRLKIRKLDKWPHEMGSNCKCVECTRQRNASSRFRKNRNKEKLNVQTQNY